MLIYKMLAACCTNYYPGISVFLFETQEPSFEGGVTIIVSMMVAFNKQPGMHFSVLKQLLVLLI